MIRVIGKSVVIIAILLITTGIGYFLISMNTLALLPEGESMGSYPSPNKECVVNVYLCDGGATVDFAIRGEVVGKAMKRNIYWQDHADDAHVIWMDDRTVSINGIKLDVYQDEYDYRDYR